MPTTWARWVDSEANSNSLTDGENCFQFVQGWEIKQRNSGQQKEWSCSNVHNVTTNALTDSEQHIFAEGKHHFGTPAFLEGFFFFFKKKNDFESASMLQDIAPSFSVKRSLFLCHGIDVHPKQLQT